MKRMTPAGALSLIRYENEKTLVIGPTNRHGLYDLLGPKVMFDPVLHRPALSATNPGARSHLAFFTKNLVHNRFIPIICQQLRFAHTLETYWLLSARHKYSESYKIEIA